MSKSTEFGGRETEIQREIYTECQMVREIDSGKQAVTKGLRQTKRVKQGRQRDSQRQI